MNRPTPPDVLFESSLEALFLPSPELAQWADETFIAEDAVIENDDHEHLRQARIGFVWTNEANERRGRLILGTAQLLPPSGDKWSVGRAVAQLREWFGDVPDFMITLYAPAAIVMDDASFLALVYHELMHCAQRRDNEGQPMFNRETGRPVWAMRAHDIEQFVSVVRQFGADAAGVRAMIDAAADTPLASDQQISIACGTCAR